MEAKVLPFHQLFHLHISMIVAEFVSQIGENFEHFVRAHLRTSVGFFTLMLQVSRCKLFSAIRQLRLSLLFHESTAA